MFHIVDKSRQINYVFVCRSGKQKSKLKLTRSCATESNIFLFARDLRVIWEQQYTLRVQLYKLNHAAIDAGAH